MIFALVRFDIKEMTYKTTLWMNMSSLSVVGKAEVER
jgi:hypothetical protein